MDRFQVQTRDPQEPMINQTEGILILSHCFLSKHRSRFHRYYQDRVKNVHCECEDFFE